MTNCNIILNTPLRARGLNILTLVLLAGFSGVLQADSYAGFNELYRNSRLTEIACWTHARRKIRDMHVRTPSALTDEALRRFGKLYVIKAEIRGQSA